MKSEMGITHRKKINIKQVKHAIVYRNKKNRTEVYSYVWLRGRKSIYSTLIC
jgi:hypothetical protein